MLETLTPKGVLEQREPLVLFAYFEPVAGLDRFQPAGFPEVGHVIYKAPRKDGAVENVCIVDSAASMANHLEALCMRGAHDYELVDELQGMPYLRCVTGNLEDGKLPPRKAGGGCHEPDRGAPNRLRILLSRNDIRQRWETGGKCRCSKGQERQREKQDQF